ncbi:MAG TPA: AAA family ATPase [Firmicutes bacterium]|nr:AAA family ATPase [Bacillota bacterium]
MPKHISVAGKGGTGKTTLSALLVRWLRENGKTPVLVVDADPNANLGEALGVQPEGTISEVLESAKTKQGVPSGMTTNTFIEYRLSQVLTEATGFDLLVLGGPEGAGCYCFPNEMLRHYMEELSGNYPYLVMDNEAGLEHLSRRVARDVDVLLVTSDPTVRGVRSAARIARLARQMKVVSGDVWFVLTMSRDGDERVLRDEIAAAELQLAGTVPYDDQVVDFDLKGRPVFDLPDGSPAYAAVREMARRLGL